jgi:nucleoside-diphosphate-sugar epimerase
LNLIKSQDHIDLYCHHAADVTHYKDPEFDCLKAVTNNTCNLQLVLKALKAQGCNKIVLTGSVFEQNEGEGSDDLKAFSPYGLSKGITSEVFRFYCNRYRFRLGKFVIPNPFGPYEEARFTSYLVKTWYANKMAVVTTPDYIRDNIHVSLLAKAYKYFIDSLDPNHGFCKISPSGYVESQKHFATRFAQEMQFRLNLECRLDCKPQTDFPEPKIRVNTLPIQKQIKNWNEKQAWDDLAFYYNKFKGEL